MTTSKRRIPINQTGPAAGRRSAPPDGGKPETAAGGAMPIDPSIAETSRPTVEAATPATTAPLAETAPLADVTRERDALADSLLRLRAEFENFRRRAARELVDARDKARGELLADLLPVLDNLERALDAAEHHDEGKVLGGVRLTRDMFLDLLRRSGVQEVETVGTPFDPRIHEAVIAQASDQDEGMVTAVLERGYRQGDRILRPARVVVSSGPGRPDDPNAAG